MFKVRSLLAITTLAIAIIVSGCDVKVKPIEGGKEIAQELERHKIKRLTQQDILNATQKYGDSILVVAERLHVQRLAEQLEKGGIAAAIPYCQPENYEEVEALQYKFGALSRRFSERPRNPQNLAKGGTAQALTRYSSGQEQGAIVEELNQNQNQIRYTSPIYLRNETCLSCHGTVGEELSQSDYDLIKAKYPQDQATGSKSGDLMGVWELTFDKGDLVAFLNDQPKKSRRPR